MRKYALLTSVIVMSMLTSCIEGNVSEEEIQPGESHFYPNAKPKTRWWWFATEIKREDVKHQLNWMKDKNFGGVEIAWVYPLYRYQKMYAKKYGRNYPKDTTAQEWLSQDWSNIVSYTKAYADSIGLSCDFTFGSAWPVAGSNIGKEHTTKVYGDSTFRQTLTFAWSWPDTLLVINHLDSHAFNKFSKPIEKALKPALKGSKSALFTDSWEIKLNDDLKIWTDGFQEKFLDKYAYDITPYMDQNIDSFPDVRYDYMMLLDEYVREQFYQPFAAKCKELGAYSRVQCLASPTDVMTTYSYVDIPETECMLNNPNYSRIVSSSAALASKPVVSSESFTCMYGFPATFLREEQIADLKMVADAMFAQGVNLHFYHGTPYNPAGSDTIDFFATTYFGPGGSLEPHLKEFNSYMERVSSLMQMGKTYSNLAVYIPFEDAVMKGAYPPERRRVWVWGEYEMRYLELADELEGYHPLYINRHFLEKAQLIEGKLNVGDASFSALYIDVEYMEEGALKKIVKLAEEDFPIILKQNPFEPGKIKSDTYSELVEQLSSLPNVEKRLEAEDLKPLIVGRDIPAYWARVDETGNCYIFLAQKKSKDLTYPVYGGQSYMSDPDTFSLVFQYQGNRVEKELIFSPYQSKLIRLDREGGFKEINIEYTPPDPEIMPREKQKMYF